ncbi:MAG: hypothetical protein IJ659_09325, partial [Alloprevotella sp.]|nr:hypothetical protein [Alloprevotella sp.]
MPQILRVSLQRESLYLIFHIVFRPMPVALSSCRSEAPFSRSSSSTVRCLPYGRFMNTVQPPSPTRAFSPSCTCLSDILTVVFLGARHPASPSTGLRSNAST